MADLSASLIPLDHKLYTHFQQFSEAYVIGPDQFCYPKNGPNIVKKLQNFQVRDDDIYVVTFPKTGTTWMQEIVYLLMNNLDFNKAKNTIRDEVFPYTDINVWEEPLPDAIADANKLPSPRLIKFHLNYSFLPPDVTEKCKIIYVCRNVKDTITSYYYFNRGMTSTKFQGSIEDFADLFMENKVPYTPYIKHVKEFWDKRNNVNVYFTTYEEMQSNQEKVIAEVAKFLNIHLNIEEIKMVADHCKFEKMKHNPAVNKSHWNEEVYLKDFQFMRKGIVGDWKNEMSSELISKIDKWIDKETSDDLKLRDLLTYSEVKV